MLRAPTSNNETAARTGEPTYANLPTLKLQRTWASVDSPSWLTNNARQDASPV
ncbi:hypothetical protein KAX75_11030 [candidate division WOR-3 bacterium]|nr:hypothetical protein [candidate division WOR-3 bacterium]